MKNKINKQINLLKLTTTLTIKLILKNKNINNSNFQKPLTNVLNNTKNKTKNKIGERLTPQPINSVLNYPANSVICDSKYINSAR